MLPQTEISTTVTLASPSTITLIVANAVPIAGLIFWNWNIGEILLLFWIEAAIIGIYTLVKVGIVDRLVFVVRGPFAAFAFAFILFWLLMVTLMISHEVNKIITGVYQKQDYAAIARSLSPAIVAFVISHGVSFVLDFLGKKEYLHFSSEKIAAGFFMHLIPFFAATLIAAFVVSAFGNVIALFLIAILVKLALDIAVHQGDHGRKST